MASVMVSVKAKLWQLKFPMGNETSNVININIISPSINTLVFKLSFMAI